MTVIKIVALIVFIISCVVIYKNTNSYEPTKRVIYIIIRNTCNICINSSSL